MLVGSTLYLSYGLALGLILPAAVVAVTGRWRAAAFAGMGASAVGVAFTAAGFWWLTGFSHVGVIYAASIAASRPYSYFVWANLAAVTFAVGPAAPRPRLWLSAQALLALGSTTCCSPSGESTASRVNHRGSLAHGRFD